LPTICHKSSGSVSRFWLFETRSRTIRGRARTSASSVEPLRPRTRRDAVRRRRSVPLCLAPKVQSGTLRLLCVTRHGSGGASPSYGVCQAAEERVSGFSFFGGQRSSHFFGLKGMLSVWITLVNVSSWSSLSVARSDKAASYSACQG